MELALLMTRARRLIWPRTVLSLCGILVTLMSAFTLTEEALGWHMNQPQLVDAS